MVPKRLWMRWVAIARTQSNRLQQLALTAGVAGATIFGLLNVSPILAQSSPPDAPPLPSFEVASIKPIRSRGPAGSINFPGSRFTARNVGAKMLIEFAYNIHPFQLSGGPSWVNSENYDVDAKVENSIVEKVQKIPPREREEQFRLMVQSLLADRFELRVKHETRELPVYALVVAKNGPKFQESKPGDTSPSGIKALDGWEHSGLRITVLTGETRIRGGGVPMASLAAMLSQQLGRTVLDQTGLKGNYNFTLNWTPDEYHAAMYKGADGGNPGPDNAPPPESSGPSIFTAIQEQLGLKLVSTKGPAEVIVIDHIERPSEN